MALDQNPSLLIFFQENYPKKKKKRAPPKRKVNLETSKPSTIVKNVELCEQKKSQHVLSKQNFKKMKEFLQAQKTSRVQVQTGKS